MNLIVSSRDFHGEIDAISSKSQAHRALICAALSSGKSRIKCNTTSKDIMATVDCLNCLGANITYSNGVFIVESIDLTKTKREINCGESGSTLRFLLPIIASLGIEMKIEMQGRLSERPLFPLDRELIKNGCKIEKQGNYLLIKGKLRPNEYVVEGNVSSQFISGLLFSLPLIEGETSITVKGDLESYSYIQMTLKELSKFGINYCCENNTFKLISNKYTTCDTAIEGDWSNSAIWLCAGALTEKGISVKGLNIESNQGDSEIIEILRQFGAFVKCNKEDVFVKKNSLRGISVDARNIPDLIPAICLVGSVANGKTIIKNANRLRIKESDRIKSVVDMINSLGGNAIETEDEIEVIGSELIGGTVNSYNDHRIAMTSAISSIVCKQPIKITNAESVEKSYPNFFKDFVKLGGIYTEEKI